MQYRTLNNGMIIPEIAFGTFPQKEELETLVSYAYNCGLRLFDTSDDYHNQTFLGKGLRNYNLYSDVFIETKISNWSKGPRRVKGMFKRCVEELDLPNGRIIDILLLHFPYPYIFVDIWKEFEELYYSGMVKSIGVCNFSKSNLEVLLSKATVKPTINQIELHPMFQQKDTCNFCVANNIQIMSYSPVARMDKRLVLSPVLNSIANKKGKNVI